MKRVQKIIVTALLSLCLCLVINLAINAQSSPPTLVKQAQQHYQRGEYQRSLQLLQQANQVYHQQGERVVSRRHRLQQGQLLSLMSLAQQQLGNWSVAKEYINDGLELVALAADSKQKQQVLGQIWQAKGHLALATGQATAALKAWQLSEAFYQSAGDRLGIKGSWLAQAEAMEDMGFYSRSCDLVLQAFNLDSVCQQLSPEQLAAIEQQINTQPQNWHITATRAAGNSLLLMGKLNQAKWFLNFSQTLREQLLEQSPQVQLKTLLSLGNLHKAIALQAKERDDLQSFTNYAQVAINYYQKLAQVQAAESIRSEYILQGQLNQLTLFIVTAQWSKAQQLVNDIDLNRSFSTVKKQNIYARVNFARSLTTLKEQQIDLSYSWSDLAAIYITAMEQARLIGDRRMESYATGYLGQLAREQNLSLEWTAQQLIEQALHLAQTSRAPEIAYRWQWQLGRVYRQQGEFTKAIAAYKTSVATLEDLRSDLVALQKEIQFSFREQVEPVYRELAALLLNNNDNNSLSSADLDQARDVIEALQLAELDNYFQDACLTYKPKKLREIDPNAALIYTIVLSDDATASQTKGDKYPTDRLEVILSLDDRTFYRHSQPIAKDQLEQQLQQLRQYLVQPDRTKDIQQLSAQLYDWLIRPFEADLVKTKRQTLVFVLDNILQTIPMSVLYDGEQYLLQKYAIALTPGLRLLNSPLTKTQPQSFVLGAGISEPVQVASQQFTSLDHVANELNSIQQVAQNKILLNSQFSESNLTEQLNSTNASIVHLATHGQFSSDPDNTFLLLWQKLLTIKDFSNLLQNRQRAITNPIELLVLSACETAKGDKLASLGLAGIAVRTGAISTLATLWQVNDNSTAALMNNIYQQLAQNSHLNKAEVLRRAQLQLWRNQQQDWQVPFFWSSYVLIGNWQ